MDTHVITVSVNREEELFASVSDDWMSVTDGR